MKTTHTATVVNGTLQFDQPLNLPELSRVEVTVAAIIDDSARRRRAVEEFIRLSDEAKVNSGERLTRDQLHERG